MEGTGRRCVQGLGIKRGEVRQSPKYWCPPVGTAGCAEMLPAPCGLQCSAPQSPLGAAVAPRHFGAAAE